MRHSGLIWINAQLQVAAQYPVLIHLFLHPEGAVIQRMKSAVFPQTEEEAEEEKETSSSSSRYKLSLEEVDDLLKTIHTTLNIRG